MFARNVVRIFLQLKKEISWEITKHLFEFITRLHNWKVIRAQTVILTRGTVFPAQHCFNYTSSFLIFVDIFYSETQLNFINRPFINSWIKTQINMLRISRMSRNCTKPFLTCSLHTYFLLYVVCMHTFILGMECHLAVSDSDNQATVHLCLTFLEHLNTGK